MIGATDVSEPTFILWGDSHAGALLTATKLAAARHGHSGLYAGMAACPPLLGVRRPGREENTHCAEFNDSVFAAIRSNRSVRTVILMARWARYADGRMYKQEPGSAMFIGDSTSKSVSFEENKAAFARGLQRTISKLVGVGKEVTIIGPVPEVGWDVPRALAMQKFLGVERQISPTRKEFDARQGTVIPVMKAMADEFSIGLVFPHDLLSTFSPPKLAARDHYDNWRKAITEGRQACAAFDFAAQLTETVILGNIAVRFPNKKLEWDSDSMTFTNSKKATKYTKQEYRKGWEVEGLG